MDSVHSSSCARAAFACCSISDNGSLMFAVASVTVLMALMA